MAETTFDHLMLAPRGTGVCGILCVLGALWCFFGPPECPLPDRLTGCVCTLCAIITLTGLYRNSGGLRLHLWGGGRRRTLHPAALWRHTRGGQDVYLGTGFDFLTAHGRRLFELMSRGDLADPGRSGDLIRRVHDGRPYPVRFPAAALGGHTLIAGTTGAGKTRLMDLLITQAVRRGDTVIVIDPKGDADLRAHLRETTRRFRPYAMDEFDVADPHSCPLNLLASCSAGTQAASRLTALMDGSGGAASFKSYAHQAVAAAAECLRLEHRELTLSALRMRIMMQDSHTAPVWEYLQRQVTASGDPEAMEFLTRVSAASGTPPASVLRKFAGWLASRGLCPGLAAVELLLGISQLDPRYYQKISAGVLPVLNTLCAAPLDHLLSSDGAMSLRDVIDQRRVLFCALHSLTDNVTSGYVGRILTAELSAVAGIIYAEGRQAGRVSVFIDECAEVASAELIQLLNKSRGAGFALTLAMQTFADLSAGAGSSGAALQIMGNCNNLISLRVRDPQSAELLAESLPKITVAGRGATLFRGYSDSPLPGLGVGMSTSLNERPLLPPGAILSLPDLHFVAQLAGGRVVTGQVPPLAPYPEIREARGMTGPDPYDAEGLTYLRTLQQGRQVPGGRAAETGAADNGACRDVGIADAAYAEPEAQDAGTGAAVCEGGTVSWSEAEPVTDADTEFDTGFGTASEAGSAIDDELRAG